MNEKVVIICGIDGKICDQHDNEGCEYIMESVHVGPEGKYKEEFDKTDPSELYAGKMTGAGSREERKWDKGKPKFSLILTDFLDLMAEILTKGEANHPKEPSGQPSWQLVEPEAYLDALIRHVQAYRKEAASLDHDMGTHHMGHVAVNAMFLYWFAMKDINDTEWDAVLNQGAFKIFTGKAPSDPNEPDMPDELKGNHHGDLAEAVAGLFSKQNTSTLRDKVEGPTYLTLDDCVDIITNELVELGMPLNDAISCALKTLEDRSWK